MVSTPSLLRLLQVKPVRGRIFLAEDGESVGLPAGSIQRQHQLTAQPFSQWILVHELLEFGHELTVAAEGEVGVDAILERRQP